MTMSRMTRLKRQRGQGMTEYIIIVALIAVAAIAVYQFFGSTVREQTAGLAREVSGQNATAQIDAARAQADAAAAEAARVKGLNAYTNGTAQTGAPD